MDLHIRIFKADEEWWGAQVIEFPGVITQAKTKDELLENVKDALALYLEAVEAQTGLSK